IAGCSVFTRPSRISGNFVSSEMSFTGRPASASVFRVPPVAINSTPYLVTSSRAKSTRPVLSETLNSARRIGRIISKPRKRRRIGRKKAQKAQKGEQTTGKNQMSSNSIRLLSSFVPFVRFCGHSLTVLFLPTDLNHSPDMPHANGPGEVAGSHATAGHFDRAIPGLEAHFVDWPALAFPDEAQHGANQRPGCPE